MSVDTQENLMELKVELTQGYNGHHIRPNCEKSKIFARIAGTTTGERPTLTQWVVDDLKLLGYTLTVTNNVTRL
jgi:ABC-type cobalamin transport system ATPase subunit